MHRATLYPRFWAYTSSAYLIPVAAQVVFPEGPTLTDELIWLVTLAPGFPVALHYGLRGPLRPSSWGPYSSAWCSWSSPPTTPGRLPDHGADLSVVRRPYDQRRTALRATPQALPARAEQRADGGLSVNPYGEARGQQMLSRRSEYMMGEPKSYSNSRLNRS